MSWSPADLVTDTDLLAYEGRILDQFGRAEWEAKRSKALEDWALPILEARGFAPQNLRTRVDPAAAFGLTSAVFTTLTSAAADTTLDDIDLAATFATPGTDYLYIGATTPYRGLAIRIDDAPSGVASTTTIEYWSGVWTALAIADGTEATSGVPFSGGGTITWTPPPDWTRRVVNGSDRLYWSRLSVSATPTSATAGQMATIRTSRLRGAVTFRTLHLIFAEAPTSQDGPWAEKAEFYQDQADSAIQRAIPLIGGEFDLDDSDQLSAGELDNTAEEAGGAAWSLERA